MIKRFIRFILGFISIVCIIDALSFTDIGDSILGRVFFSTGYRKVGSIEICPAIKKAETRNNYSKIVLGDSVCHQIFSEFQNINNEYLLLGTNQAITMDGQYILARLFIDSHPEATDVYLVLLPGAFSSGYDSEMSYSYLIEPFGKSEKLYFLSEYTLDSMSNLYGRAFVNKSVINFIDNSSINNKVFLFYNQKKMRDLETDYALLSGEAEYYIRDLNNICVSRNIAFHILPGPIKDVEEEHVFVKNLEGAINNSDLANLFDDYFNSITYYPEVMFPDGVHFGGEYSNTDVYRQCLDNLKVKSKSFDGLSY